MSGHSKWSTIKRDKEAKDQKRGTAFTKLSRAIMIAVREGGSNDPEMNFALRLAIDKAKSANMPKENIQKAIDRGEGKGSAGEVQLKEIIYEGFGPDKTAIIIEVLTDNTNRTYAELKKIFDREGGRLASPGSVAYLFQKKGLIVLEKPENLEESMLKLIDLGVEDVEEVESGVEVYVPTEKLAQMKDLLTQTAGFKAKEMEIVMKPKTSVLIDNQRTAEKLVSLMETVSSHDDVQKAWANFDLQPKKISPS